MITFIFVTNTFFAIFNVLEYTKQILYGEFTKVTNINFPTTKISPLNPVSVKNISFSQQIKILFQLPTTNYFLNQLFGTIIPLLSLQSK